MQKVSHQWKSTWEWWPNMAHNIWVTCKSTSGSRRWRMGYNLFKIHYGQDRNQTCTYETSEDRHNIKYISLTQAETLRISLWCTDVQFSSLRSTCSSILPSQLCSWLIWEQLSCSVCKVKYRSWQITQFLRLQI